MIMGLEEDSSYTITVTASNSAGSSAVSNLITAMQVRDVGFGSKLTTKSIALHKNSIYTHDDEILHNKNSYDHDTMHNYTNESHKANTPQEIAIAIGNILYGYSNDFSVRETVYVGLYASEGNELIECYI